MFCRLIHATDQQRYLYVLLLLLNKTCCTFSPDFQHVLVSLFMYVFDISTCSTGDVMEAKTNGGKVRNYGIKIKMLRASLFYNNEITINIPILDIQLIIY